MKNYFPAMEFEPLTSIQLGYVINHSATAIPLPPTWKFYFFRISYNDQCIFDIIGR